MVKPNSEVAVSDVADRLKAFTTVKSSRAEAFTGHRSILIGRQGEGKTIASFSISEKFTLEAKVWTTLSDLLVLQFDSEGVLSAYGHKLEVPHVDLSTVPGGSLDKAIEVVFKEVIIPQVQAGTLKAITVDSISSYDAVIKTHLSQTLEGQDLWTSLLAKHVKFFNRLRELPCHVVVIAHGTAVTAARTTKNEDAVAEHDAQLTAAGLEVGEIKMDITGQGAKYYRRNFSNIWPVKAKGPGHNRTYAIYPYGTEGFEWKCRLKGLNKEEPCDLQDIIRRAKEE